MRSLALLLVVALVASCAGSATDRSKLRAGEQHESEPLWAMVDGNDASADRINLVFAPWGWDDHDAFVELVTSTLSWDGRAYLINDAGHVTDDQQTAVAATLGTFAIEPWRSARDRFNLWVTDLTPETPVDWLHGGPLPFSLPDSSTVVVALDAHRFSPDLGPVSGFDTAFLGPGAPVRPAHGDPFAHTVVTVDGGAPAWGMAEVPHELGHGLFGLADEYVGRVHGHDGRTEVASWPSCAHDRLQADDWWGDLVGAVDPMVEIWIDETADAGFPIDETVARANVEVGVIDGGCYDVPGSARATQDSLMNSGIPVLGSVNRRWAERVLALWEG